MGEQGDLNAVVELELLEHAGDVRFGTTAHVARSTGTIGILLTPLQMAGPTPTQFMREFWQYAFGAC